MKIKKAIQQKFIKDAISILDRNNAFKVENSPLENEYTLVTIFGKLHIRIDNDNTILFSVFMRFESLENSFYSFFNKEEINNHSFKWNLHSEDGDYILNELEERLDNLVYANKVIRISDAVNESIQTVMDWREEKINETFEGLYKSKDLFNENPENLPIELQAVLNAFSEKDGDSYETCSQLVEELEKIGYTCEYYLDAQPFNLRKL